MIYTASIRMVMFRIIQIIILWAFFNVAYADELKPFVSDGCSVFPDGTIRQSKLWLKCCITHDKAYWQGGSYEQKILADVQLKECVSSVGEKRVADLMLAGVRVGGSAYFPTGFRWGYGWPYSRGYELISDEERKQIKIKLEEYELAKKN